MKERRGAWNASSHSGDLYREIGETCWGKAALGEAGSSPQYPQKALDHSLGGGYLWSLLSGSTVNANECS